MRFRVLVTAPYFLPEVERFRAGLEAAGIELVTTDVSERLEEDELLPLVGAVDGVICGDDRFSERVLAAAPRLRVLSKWGTGIDSIDQEACRRRGVRVCRTLDAFSGPVAESVLGYALVFARGLVRMDRGMKRGLWSKERATTLAESTFGVIGVGNVGKAVARRVRALGPRLLGNDLVAMPAEFLAETGIRMLGLEELLEQSDFVSVNCDLNPTSLRLMNARTFARMKAGAVLINTARGPIVDETALVDALRTGRLGGAALDVFEREPLPADSPLRSMDNVLLAPHNSNSSPSAWERVHRSTLAQLAEALGAAYP
jgi:D-3-phosphoglycerate dehydrogenase / 2-oxoglutarate reductase